MNVYTTNQTFAKSQQSRLVRRADTRYLNNGFKYNKEKWEEEMNV